MYKILVKKQLTPLIYYMEIDAPRVAASAKPGQFLIVKSSEKGERIPLTICDYDSSKGVISIVIQIVGASSYKICMLKEGEYLDNVLGPLGKPSDFMDFTDEQLKNRRYIFIAGGVGSAPIYPQVKYLYNKGVYVDVIIGARNKDLLVMEDQMRNVCNNLYVCTDDGSKGEKGLVTNLLERLIENGEKYDSGVAIGPMVMMKFVTLSAKKYNLPLVVSLNTLMVDGTGMCGACRVSVAGKMKFACVDGPEFNAYDVDFDEAMRRQRIYNDFEDVENKKLGLDTLLKR